MAATYEPIATTTLSSNNSSITFNSISSAYTDFRIIVGNLKVGGAGAAVRLRFNGDTASNYSSTRLTGSGSGANSSRVTSVNGIYGSTNSGGTESSIFFDVFSYTGSTYKTVLASYSQDYSGAGVSEISVGLWRSTSAITSVTITSLAENMNIGTIVTLYGIKAA